MPTRFGYHSNKASTARRYLRLLCGGWLVVWACGLVLMPPWAAAVTPQEQMQFADGLFARGLYDLALDEYLRITRDSATFEQVDVALYRVGESYRRLGEPGAADRFYLRVMREHPDSPYARRAEFRSAETQWLRGEYEVAYESLAHLLERNDLPTALQWPAWYYRGDAARRLGRLDAARTAWQRILDAGIDSPLVAYAALDLADLYRADPDRAEEVRALYGRAAETALDDESASAAWLRKAEWYFAQGAYHESAAAFDRLRAQWPEQAQTQAARLPTAWAYYHVGRYADTAALIDEGLPAAEAAGREQADWLYLLANTQRQLLRPEAARATYGRLLAEFPDHELAAVARYERVLLSFREERYEEAVDEMVQLDPTAETRPDVYWMLAESYAALGRDDEAVQYYRLLLDADPVPERAVRATYRLGQLLLQRGDTAQAARLWQQVAADHPDADLAPYALFEAGVAWARLERYADAIREWDRFARRYPDHAWFVRARLQQGLAHLEVGQETEALAVLTEVRTQTADPARAGEAAFWVGVLHERAGRDEAAETAWNEAVDRLTPSSRQARAQYRLALLLQRQGRAAEAADRLQPLVSAAAVEDWPSALLHWLADYQLAAGNYGAALDVARGARQRSTATADEQQWAHYIEGRALLGLGRRDEGQAALQQALETDGWTRAGAEAAWQLGELALDTGERAAAQGFFEQAAERAGEEAWADVRARAYFGLGRVAEQRQEWRDAARYYLSVGVLFDDTEWVPEALFRAARALQQADRPAEMKRTLDELVERFPDHEWTARAREL